MSPVNPGLPTKRGVFQRVIAPRAFGLVLLGLAGLALWMIYDTRSASMSLLSLVPFLGAPGAWLFVFGYPVDGTAGVSMPSGERPMAPRWWRLGLMLWIVTWLVVISVVIKT